MYNSQVGRQSTPLNFTRATTLANNTIAKRPQTLKLDTKLFDHPVESENLDVSAMSPGEKPQDYEETENMQEQNEVTD